MGLLQNNSPMPAGLGSGSATGIFFSGAKSSAFFAIIFFQISVVIFNSTLYTHKYLNFILVFSISLDFLVAHTS